MISPIEPKMHSGEYHQYFCFLEIFKVDGGYGNCNLSCGKVSLTLIKFLGQKDKIGSSIEKFLY